MIIRSLTLALLFPCVCACGAEEPTIDASSEASVLASINEMISVHPDRERELRAAINSIARSSIRSINHMDAGIRSSDDARQRGVEIFLNRIAGKNIDEVIQEMERSSED